MCGRVLTKQRLGAHKDVWQCVLRAVAVCPQRRGGFMLSSGVAQGITLQIVLVVLELKFRVAL